MYLLQAEVAWMKDIGLRGWDLVIWGLIVLGVIFLWRIMPRLIKKENKAVVAAITKEEFNGLVKENGLLMNENETVIRRLGNIEQAITELKNSLSDAKQEREWFNNTNVERLTVMSNRIQEVQAQAVTASQNSLMAIIYNDQIKPLIRMTTLIEYIKKGWNGGCVKFAITDLILPHKDLWESLFTKPDDLEDVVDKKHYFEMLEMIRVNVR